MARHYSQYEKPNYIFSDRNGPNKDKRFFLLRVGKIVDIDYDRYQFKLEWENGEGFPDWIPMSFPYVGPGSCIAAMPEIGALAICHYLNDDAPGAVPKPLCVGFLPTGLAAGLESNAIKLLPDSLPTQQENIVYMRFRKLQKGDLTMASLFGGEIFLNRDIEIKDSVRDNILIRSSDQSIISTSLHNFIFANGVSVNAGTIIRNNMAIFDANGVRIPDQLAREVSLPDGRDNVHLVPFGGPIQENTQYYTEYRVDVDDIANGHIEANNINSQTSLTDRDPIVSMVLGNYAGAYEDSYNKSRYGKILRPVLFNSPNDTQGSFSLVECVQNKGVDEVSTLGLAYALHILKKDSFLGFDKEGHYYLNLNSSSNANPLGAGRSMSILANGNLKETWGSSAETANSWDLATLGGVKWNIGQHNDLEHTRSIDIRTTSSTYIEVGGSETDPVNDPDFNVNPSSTESTTQYSRKEIISGNQKLSIGGTEKVEVAGNSILKVAGLRQERIGGSASYEYQTDKSENVLGVYTQVAIKEMQGRFGKRKETVYLGQELTVMTGDIVETIATFGNKKTRLVRGDITEMLLSGSRSVIIGVGDYKVTVGVGGVKILAPAGSVDIKALNGISVKGLKADIATATVSLGLLPVKGGVVTSLTHFDYTVGLPLRPSMTVTASM